MRCVTAIAMTATALACVADSALGQSNVDPDHKFAWAENIGWTNWRDANGGADGVRVFDSYLSGWIWCENVGWLSVGDGTPGGGSFYTNADGSDFGVNIADAAGNLEGFGWSENTGWVKFDTSVLGQQRARYDRVAGRFRGFAWGENIGWINLDDDEHFVGVSVLPLSLDIKPAACPNSFNRESHGVLPVALLGTANLDIMQIDRSTVRLSRADGVGGSLSPHEGPPGPHSVYEDVAAPLSDGETCECHEAGPDGFMDLSMKFKTDDVVASLELNDLDTGALVALVVTGSLVDGTPFQATDCVRLVPPGTPPGLVAVGSTAASAWVGMSPLDLQLDGGGFADFERTYPLGTVATFTAEQSYQGKRFVGWRTNGAFQSAEPSLTLTVADDSQTVEAIHRWPGDIDGDDGVNLSDFATFATCFHGSGAMTPPAGCSVEEYASADLDGDGDVDLADFATFALNYGGGQ